MPLKNLNRKLDSLSSDLEKALHPEGGKVQLFVIWDDDEPDRYTLGWQEWAKYQGRAPTLADQRNGSFAITEDEFNTLEDRGFDVTLIRLVHSSEAINYDDKDDHGA